MNTRTTISHAVRHLMIDRDMNYTVLAKRMEVRSYYMPRKVQEARWSLDDLEKLAEIFGVEPWDFLQGYQHIKENYG